MSPRRVWFFGRIFDWIELEWTGRRECELIADEGMVVLVMWGTVLFVFRLHGDCGMVDCLPG